MKAQAIILKKSSCRLPAFIFLVEGDGSPALLNLKTNRRVHIIMKDKILSIIA
jgi:hypothetical protein